MRGFTKGLFIGTIAGGAICLMMEPCTSAKVRKMRRRANKTIKNMGCIIEDFISRK